MYFTIDFEIIAGSILNPMISITIITIMKIIISKKKI